MRAQFEFHKAIEAQNAETRAWRRIQGGSGGSPLFRIFIQTSFDDLEWALILVDPDPNPNHQGLLRVRNAMNNVSRSKTRDGIRAW